MHLTLVSEDQGIVRIRNEGPITIAEFQPGTEPLEVLLGPDCFIRKVLLDLGETPIIDTSGVSWLLNCHNRFMARGGVLVLHSTPPLINNMLRLLSVDQVLRIADDDATARALALGGPA